MKSITHTLLLILFTLTFYSDCTYSQSPYKLETGREALLLGGGFGLGILTLHLESNIKSIKYNELQNLSRENVNAFDRGATYNWSEDASIVSDYLLNFMLISPMALLFSDKVRDDFGTFSVMYIENLFLSFAAVHTTKILIKRKRPYVYNKNVPLKYKSDSSSRLEQQHSLSLLWASAQPATRCMPPRRPTRPPAPANTARKHALPAPIHT